MPLHLFLVSEWKGDPSRCNDEHAEVRWFDPVEAAALPDLLSPDYRPILVALAPGGSAVDHATACAAAGLDWSVVEKIVPLIINLLPLLLA